LFSFDVNYANRLDECGVNRWKRACEGLSLPSGGNVVRVSNREAAEKWLDAFQDIKLVMDYWLSGKQGKEKEIQQLLARENNLILPASDYFVCDLEYAIQLPSCKARFD